MNKPTPEQLADITKRLQTYYSNLTPDKKNYIRGMSSETGKIVLQKDDKTAHVSIEDLETGKFNFDTFGLNPVVEEKVEIMEEPVEQLAVEQQPVVQEDNSINNKMTLNDIKTLVELNNKETLDKIIVSFAKNEDGTPNISGAIVEVLNNSMNAAVTSIMENRPFSTELYKYDVTGKLIVPEDVSTQKVSKEEVIKNSFDNVLIYTDVANMYGTAYTDSQKEIARSSYVANVDKLLAQKGYTEPVVQEQPVPEPINVPEQTKQMVYAPVADNKKAGFADVFILAIIVLVYTAIIVNLVMKLK